MIAFLHWLVPVAVLVAFYVRSETQDDEGPRTRRVVAYALWIASTAALIALLWDLWFWSALSGFQRVHHAIVLGLGLAGFALFHWLSRRA